ncbi:MAG: sensor histidine kinase [Pseudomonadota bacterium]
MQMPGRFLWFPFPLPGRRRQAAHDAALAGLRAELDRTRQAAAEQQRAHHACLARTTHELRTPLNAVLGYTQLLLAEGGLTARQSHKLATIDRAGQHLLALVDEILDLASMEAGGFSLRPAPLALPALLDEVIALARPQAEPKRLVLRLEAPALPGRVVADGQRLRQVLLNLLANAVRFTDAGEVVLRARAEPSPGSWRLRFEVADTGVGIAAADLPHLFQPFRQVGDPARRGGGTGLGLLISRQLVRAMGGEIEARSSPGQGSCFGFSLVLPPPA